MFRGRGSDSCELRFGTLLLVAERRRVLDLDALASSERCSRARGFPRLNETFRGGRVVSMAYSIHERNA